MSPAPTGYRTVMSKQQLTIDAEGGFVRSPGSLVNRITSDGRSDWPVEAGRYRIAVSLACPWANRSLIVRRLMGLEDAISVAIADPVQDERSWRFTLDPGDRDPVLGIRFLAEAYEAAGADPAEGVSVPAVVDVPTGQVVTNDYHQITLDLATQWGEHARPGAPDLYPERLRDEIDEVMELVYRDVNDAVYRAGFAQSQAAYEKAFTALFDRLDWLAARLERRRYLVGDHITEADVRLFTTLARFDVVYHNHFKCNREKLTENPVLWAYARDLYQTPGVGDTINFEHIKRHYYLVHEQLNPLQIVPAGPDLSLWHTPHRREELGGSPFGDGTAPERPCDLQSVPAEPTG
jgi:glutathionyl-hydroquinone reductase